VAIEPRRAAGTDTPLPLLALLIVLTATTGLVDAVSVLGLGRVFTANMTGNVAFLGFALAGAPEFSAVRSVAALAAFLLGATIGGRMGVRLGGSQRSWITISLVVESSLFLLAALCAALVGAQISSLGWQVALIMLTAAAMGLRNATIRRLAVPDMTTTVLTLTPTGLGADSRLAGSTNPRWPRRLASVGAMLVGAAVGALLVLRMGVAVPLCLTGLGTLAATAAFLSWPDGKSTRSD
jgi:uncharacterized membrane protein YoaK (UPF0700 family)